MTSTTASDAVLDDKLAASDTREDSVPGSAPLSVRRVNIMRIGYLVMGLGLAVTKWPLLIQRQGEWPLYEGITNYMLFAMGLLALLGLRYPVKMLPILLFESVWKLAWLFAVALPLWAQDRLDPATAEHAGAILWVVVVLVVIPWRYVWARYAQAPGDGWRSTAAADSGR